MITTTTLSDNTNLVTIHVKELCGVPPTTTLDLIAKRVMEAGTGYMLTVNVENINISDVQRNSKTIEDIAKLFRILPEVRVCQIVNAPHTFQSIFKLVRPFIDPTTLQKITVIPKKKSENYINTLVNDMDSAIC